MIIEVTFIRLHYWRVEASDGKLTPVRERQIISPYLLRSSQRGIGITTNNNYTSTFEHSN
jgi:hypothetical protein